MSRWLKAGENPGDEASFHARVTATYLGTLDSGKEYIEVMFEQVVKEGVPGIQSKKLWLTEAGWDHTEKCLKTLGWDPEQNAYAFEELRGGAETPIAGAECIIVVIAERGAVQRPRLQQRRVHQPAERRRAARADGEGRGRGFRRSHPPKLKLNKKARRRRTEKAAAEGAKNAKKQAQPADVDDDEDDNFDDIPF